MNKIHDPLIFADQTDVITNFAVITNVDINRVHCRSKGRFFFNFQIHQCQMYLDLANGRDAEEPQF